MLCGPHRVTSTGGLSSRAGRRGVRAMAGAAAGAATTWTDYAVRTNRSRSGAALYVSTLATTSAYLLTFADSAVH